jgi:hypothetical protein
MPLEIVVSAFVLVAFGAILWRFLPRAADGSIRLPDIVDRSIGMWLLRRATGRGGERPTSSNGATAGRPTESVADPVAGTPRPSPTQPTRFVVSRAPSKADATGLPPVHLRRVVGDAPVGHRPMAHPASSSMRIQRRSAGAVALAVGALVLAGLAIGTRQLGGEVLSATGTPVASLDGGGAVSATGSPAIEPTDDGLASPSPLATPSPVPTASPTATPTVTPTATPKPTRTPRPTQRPTPRPTKAPTPTPAATPTPTPTPSATPESPTPEPSAAPSA